jgi:hypothetical protein
VVRKQRYGKVVLVELLSYIVKDCLKRLIHTTGNYVKLMYLSDNIHFFKFISGSGEDSSQFKDDFSTISLTCSCFYLSIYSKMESLPPSKV